METTIAETVAFMFLHILSFFHSDFCANITHRFLADIVDQHVERFVLFCFYENLCQVFFDFLVDVVQIL